MPARHNGGSLAEDEGRLLEAHSSREDDEPAASPGHGPDDLGQGHSPSGGSDADPQSSQSSKQPEGSSSRGKHRDKSPNLSVETKTSHRGRGSPGQAPPPPKVVYYQNRFITIPGDPGPGPTGSATSGDTASGRQRGQHELGPAGSREREGGSTRQEETMEPIQLDEPQVKRSKLSGLGKTHQVLKRIYLCLEDNRMKTGNQETQDKLKDMNLSQSESHQILKKILNIIFVTTGVSLFLAVIIVIIYTSIGEFEQFLAAVTWIILQETPVDVVWFRPKLGVTKDPFFNFSVVEISIG